MSQLRLDVKQSAFLLSRGSLLGLLFLLNIISYLDRAALPVLAPIVSHDLRLGPAEIGAIFSGFSVGYALFCLVGGWAADKFRPEYVLLTAAVAWSLFCGLTSTASSIGALLVLRVLFGMGEGGVGAVGTKLIGLYVPRPRQATALAFTAAGSPVGGFLAGPLVVFLAIAAGWRMAFVVIAAFGLGWSLAWALFCRMSFSRSFRQPADRAADDELSSSNGACPSLSETLMQPAMIAVAFAFFSYSYILYFFLSWFPSYLSLARHLSLHSMSFFNAIPWALGTIGLGCGGVVSDQLFRRTGNALLSRKIIVVTGLALAACCVTLMSTVTTVFAAVTLMSIAIFFLYLSGSLYFVLMLDLAPAALVGKATGAIHFVATCAGIVAPIVTGLIVRSSDDYTAAFILAGTVAILGVVGLSFFLPSTKDDHHRAKR